MKVRQLLDELNLCHLEAEVDLAIEMEDGSIEFYKPTFVTTNNNHDEWPVMINSDWENTDEPC